MKKFLSMAIKDTIPVMLGYISVGIAFGLFSSKSGFSFQWALLMSVFIYAGSMQFVTITLLTSGVSILQAGITSFIVNFRHVVYGLSFIQEFKNMKRVKPYLIFSLTDETFALLVSKKVPANVSKAKYFFTISFLNQLYWVIGTLIGSVAGSLMTFNTNGIEFAMTALFIVICVEQILTSQTAIPSVIGIATATLCLFVFGPQNMLIPSIILIITILTPLKTTFESQDTEVESQCQ